MLPFLARVSKIYREQTSYHNFQHALDVLQAVYCYLHEAGCIPSVEVLLEQEQWQEQGQGQEQEQGQGQGQGQEAGPTSSRVKSGTGEFRVPTVADGGPSTPRPRKLWRRPRSGGTLLQRALRNQDLFALFIAAIGHDIGHPGVSNAFLVNHRSATILPMTTNYLLEKCKNTTRRAL